MTTDYKADLKQATAELNEMYVLLANLEIQIAKQQRRVAALKSLTENDEEFEIVPDPNLGGLTESISSVLKAAFPEPLTTFQIRENLKALHFPIHNYKNFRGSLHTVLKRLIDGGHIQRQEEPQLGETAFRWATSIKKETWVSRAAKKNIGPYGKIDLKNIKK